MRIRKYDVDYGRRSLLQKAALGAGAGVLAPLWPMIASGDMSKAYPDELTSVDMYSKGKIKTGDTLTAANVDAVKDLLDPITYKQVKEMGRKIEIVATVKDPTVLYPMAFLETTLKNKGKAKLAADGNIVEASSGNPWIGGLAFAEPKTPEEAIANLTLSWGRHDYCQYAIRQWDIAPDGGQAYQYDFVWAELQAQARVDGTTFQNKKDLLRLQSVWFTAPQDISGSSFLSTWYYDQHKFPDLYGYLPAFKRVRQFPTNQRFEPLLPGITWFLTDAWAAGDPMLTWGNYKIVGRQPMLGYVGSANFMGGRGGKMDNWERPVHGGPKNQTFFDTYAELVPECLVVEAEPTGYGRAPVSKKRTWIDVRNGMYVAYVTYDRRGEVWKSFEPCYAQYANEKTTVMDNGHPAWSRCFVHSFDAQANRMSRFVQAKEVTGGYKSAYSPEGVDVYNKYLTVQAIQRLGQA